MESETKDTASPEPGLPYSREHVSGSVIQKTSEAAKSSLLEATKGKSYLSEVLEEKLTKTVGPEAARLIAKVFRGKTGDARFLGPNDDSYQITREALDAYNRTHAEPITMPTLVVVAQKAPSTFYHAISDTVVIKQSHTNLPRPELKAIIAHELGHKVGFQKDGVDVFFYNTNQHAKAIAPSVYESCKAAGLSDEEIRKALPSDRFAGFAAYTDKFAPPLTRHVLTFGDDLEWLSSPLQMLTIEYKVRSNDACNQDVTLIERSRGKVLDKMYSEANAYTRGLEIQADKIAAESVGAKDLAMGLARVTKLEGINYTAEEEVSYDHPSLATRLANIGCTMTSTEEVDSINCLTPLSEILPNEKDKKTR